MTNSPKHDASLFISLGKYMALGTEIVVIVLLPLAGGIYLDKWLGWTPWLTLTGIGIGLVATIRRLIKIQ